MKTKHMTTLHLRNSIGRSPLRLGLPRVQPIWIIRGFLLIPLVLAWFALSPSTRAVLPAPDGGYANNNTAEGDDALFSLITGSNNTANGYQALYSNTTGYHNTANGYYALYSNTTGGSNTAEGYQALQNNTGSDNTGLGVNAGLNLTTGSQNIDIGNSGVAGESNTMRIGRAANQTRAFIAGIAGVAVTGSAVLVSSGGQLGVAASSARFKQNIQAMGEASDQLL